MGASVEASTACMEIVYYFCGRCYHGSFHGGSSSFYGKSRVIPRKLSTSLWKEFPWKLRAAPMEAPFIASMEAFIAYFHGNSWKLPLK